VVCSTTAISRPPHVRRNINSPPGDTQAVIQEHHSDRDHAANKRDRAADELDREADERDQRDAK
jgi:hypothetical protein